MKGMTMANRKEKKRIKLAFALAEATWKTGKEYHADALTMATMMAMIVGALTKCSDCSIDEILAVVQARATQLMGSEHTGTAGTYGSAKSV